MQVDLGVDSGVDPACLKARVFQLVESKVLSSRWFSKRQHADPRLYIWARFMLEAGSEIWATSLVFTTLFTHITTHQTESTTLKQPQLIENAQKYQASLGESSGPG